MFGIKKKTPEEKMEKLLKRGDWNALNEYAYDGKDSKITLAKVCEGSNDNSCIDILLRLLDDKDEDVIIASANALRVVGTDHVTAEIQQLLLKTPKENQKLRDVLSSTMQALRTR